MEPVSYNKYIQYMRGQCVLWEEPTACAKTLSANRAFGQVLQMTPSSVFGLDIRFISVFLSDFFTNMH